LRVNYRLFERLYSHQSILTLRYFTIVGARTLQHGQNYKAILSYKGDDVMTEVNIAMEGNDNEEEFDEKKFSLTYDGDHAFFFEVFVISFSRIPELILFIF
jgi:hypothetical protein